MVVPPVLSSTYLVDGLEEFYCRIAIESAKVRQLLASTLSAYFRSEQMNASVKSVGTDCNRHGDIGSNRSPLVHRKQHWSPKATKRKTRQFCRGPISGPRPGPSSDPASAVSGRASSSFTTSSVGGSTLQGDRDVAAGAPRQPGAVTAAVPDVPAGFPSQVHGGGDSPDANGAPSQARGGMVVTGVRSGGLGGERRANPVPLRHLLLLRHHHSRVAFSWYVCSSRTTEDNKIIEKKGSKIIFKRA
jgi:hypothetical protein